MKSDSPESLFLYLKGTHGNYKRTAIQSIYTWEGMHRKGETMTVEEAQQMDIAERTKWSTELLWSLLTKPEGQ